jgi:hypothetical protein
MNYKNKITRNAQAATIAKLVMRYIPIIIKRLGKTIGPGGVTKLVDAVVQFITSKSQVNEQDARAAAEQYLREHPEVAQQFSQQPAQAKMAISLRTSGWKGKMVGEVAGGALGGAAGVLVPGLGETGVSEVAGEQAGQYLGGKIGDYLGGKDEDNKDNEDNEDNQSGGSVNNDLGHKGLVDTMMEKDTMYKKYSDTAQDFISNKIRILKDEGKSQEQAVAIAINMARENGYKVPPRK